MIEYNNLYELTKDLKVLYVEDDVSFQKETCELLDYFFINVDLANDGEVGLKKYLAFHEENSNYYDIVITDINMPHMNGVELSKAIYKHNEDQPIIVISAHDEARYLLELVNIGIEQFLQKPIVYDKILEVLYNTSKKIIKNSSSKNENSDSNIFNLDNKTMWDRKKDLLLDGELEIKLTKKETALMQLFIKNSSKISTNEEIFATLWSDEEHLASCEALAPIISRFRKKLPLQIENIYGLGYRLVF